jgi:hypothetical protein
MFCYLADHHIFTLQSVDELNPARSGLLQAVWPNIQGAICIGVVGQTRLAPLMLEEDLRMKKLLEWRELLFAFKNDHNIRYTHRLHVYQRSHVLEYMLGQITVRFLCPNILPSVL